MKPRSLLIGCLGSLALAGITTVTAEPASDEEKGRRIAVEADRRDSGFRDSRAQAEMIIRKRRGTETRRRLEISVLEDPVRGDINLVRFLGPPDVAGTALLTRTRPGGDEEQWLYLPALKRTKRIAASHRTGAFMGSEFSYEDFALREPADFAYRYLSEEALAGRPVHRLERRPRYAGSGYARQEVWLDRETYRLVRVRFFDAKDRPLKTLDAAGYRLHSGRFWRADTLRMGNLQTGDTTRLLWSGQRLGIGLDPRDFSRGALDAP